MDATSEASLAGARFLGDNLGATALVGPCASGDVEQVWESVRKAPPAKAMTIMELACSTVGSRAGVPAERRPGPPPRTPPRARWPCPGRNEAGAARVEVRVLATNGFDDRVVATEEIIVGELSH